MRWHQKFSPALSVPSLARITPSAVVPTREEALITLLRAIIFPNALSTKVLNNVQRNTPQLFL